VRVCPSGVLALQDGQAVVARPEACAYTGLCEMACPTGAIQRPFEIVLLDGEKPTKVEDSELRIAIAGPLVNLGIAAGLVLLSGLLHLQGWLGVGNVGLPEPPSASRASVTLFWEIVAFLVNPYYENTQPLATSQEAASAGATQDKDV